MGSKGSTTTNSAQSYTPNAVAPISYALQTAINASQTPYQNYNGELTAGLQPQQQAGMAGINQYANAAQPYIQNAQNYINQGAQNPLQNVQQYMNPYTQSVVDATQNQFNASNQTQQSQLLGNAAASGALGGDRAAVAQADLAKQQNLAQNPVISGLYSTGFNNALTAAQTQQNALFNAGYGTGSLGTAAQNAGLQGASAQIQGGTLAQQTQQAQDTANYNEFLRQAGYPFQTSQFLTQATAGLAPSLGGSGVGVSQTTPAQPSLIGQIAGLALTGAGLASGNPLMASSGAKGATGGAKGATSGGASGGAAAGLPFNRGGAVGGFASGGMTSGLGLLDYILPMAKAIRDHLRAVPVTQPDGIIVPRAGFADGGSPDFDSDFGAFATPPDATPENQALALALAQKYDPVDPITLNAGAPLPRPRPDEAPANPDAVAGPDDPSALPAAAEPTAGLTPPGGLQTDTPQSPTNGSEWANTLRQAIAGVGDYKPQASSVSPLVAAGLGMLASGSPFPGVAIGKGGLEGLSAVEKAQANQRADATTQANLALHKGTLAAHGLTAEQAAAHLVQQAQQHAATLAETARQHDVTQLQPVKMGTTVDGRDIYGIRDPKTKQLIPLDPQTGKPLEPQANPQNYVPPGSPTSSNEDTTVPPKATYTSSDHAEGTHPETLSEYPPKMASTVKAIAEGRQSLTTVPQKFRKAYQDAVNTYDDNWDQNVFRARSNMQADMATGNTGKLIMATNQLLPHLKTASDKAIALSNNNYPAANTVANWYLQQTGDPRFKAFDTVRTVAATDAARLLRGTGAMSIEEIRGWEDRLKNSGSPQQLQSVLSLLGDDLIGARISSIQHQYKTVMHKDAPDFVSPEAKDAMETLRKRNPDNPQSTTAAKPQGSPTGPRAIPDTVRQNGHTYQKQQDGSYKAID